MNEEQADQQSGAEEINALAEDGEGGRVPVPSRRESPLRDVLRRKLARLQESALKNKGEIRAEHLAAIERLSRTLRLLKELDPPPSRWPPVIVLLVALSVVSALLSIRMPTTEIALELDVTELGFVVPTETPLISRAGVVQLGVSGLDSVRVSPAGVIDLGAASSGHTLRMVQVSVGPNDGGAISTAVLIPPAGTQAWLRQMGDPRTYRFSLKPANPGTEVLFRSDLRGRLEMAAPGVFEEIQTPDFGRSGGSIQFQSSRDIMDIDFVLKDSADLQFYSQVPVSGLSLIRVEEFTASGRSLVNPLSTVLGGALYLESIHGEKQEVRPGEFLRFRAVEGRIETLKLRGDHIFLRFRGQVGGLEVGGGGSSRNLMPSVLEWLKARQPLSLIWGSTLFVYGLLMTLKKWSRLQL